MIPDLSKDAPVEVNEKGGKHSALDVSLVGLPPNAIFAVGRVLATGAKKYPDDPDGTPNWHRIDVRDQLNHMLTHAMAYLAGDTQDDHLEHMACRALMALERKYLDEKKKQLDDFWESESKIFAAGFKVSSRPVSKERRELLECDDITTSGGCRTVHGPTAYPVQVIYGFQMTPEDAELFRQFSDPNLGCEWKPTLKCGEAKESDWWLAGFNRWLKQNPAARDEEEDLDYLKRYFRSGMDNRQLEWFPPLTGYRLEAGEAGRKYAIEQNLLDP